MNSCAITDHGTMAGIVEFYKICKKNDIHALLGIESYTTKDPNNTEKKEKDNYHLIIIAKDNIGLSRLMELSSRTYLNNFYYRPRIYIEDLQYLAGHCIITSACLGSIFSKNLKYIEDDYGITRSYIEDLKNEEILKFFMKTFKDDFYLELIVWNDTLNIQNIYNEYLLNLGKKHNCQFVITGDCHYLNKEDYKLHELLMAMQMKKTLEEFRSERKRQHGPDFYIASPEEMLKRAQSLNCEEAYYNTIEVANKCNVELELGKYKDLYFDITQEPDYKDFIRWKNRRG